MYETYHVVFRSQGVWDRATACCAWNRVRHEAAEALGAIGTDKCECTLRQYEDDEVLEVHNLGETSAVQRTSTVACRTFTWAYNLSSL
jgi:hypothetical protein